MTVLPEKEINQLDILQRIADRLNAIHDKLSAIDSHFENYALHCKGNGVSPTARVEKWTNRLKKK